MGPIFAAARITADAFQPKRERKARATARSRRNR